MLTDKETDTDRMHVSEKTDRRATINIDNHQVDNIIILENSHGERQDVKKIPIFSIKCTIQARYLFLKKGEIMNLIFLAAMTKTFFLT